MFMTKCLGDPESAEWGRVTSSPNRVHAIVHTSFESGLVPEQRSRALWRGNDEVMLILSPNGPKSVPELAKSLGIPESHVKTQEVGLSFEKGSRLMFMLTLNSVKNTLVETKEERLSRQKSGGKRPSNRAIAVRPEALNDWFCHLYRNPAKYGFDVLPTDVSSVSLPGLRFKREKGIVTLAAADFRGVLTVTDPEKFAKSVAGGFGGGKAYGMGLMLLRPVSPE